MTIHVITATETADLVTGLSFSEPVVMTQRDVYIARGMEFNQKNWPRCVCQNDTEREGWDRAQKFKEL